VEGGNEDPSTTTPFSTLSPLVVIVMVSDDILCCYRFVGSLFSGACRSKYAGPGKTGTEKLPLTFRLPVLRY
jgi:hypothetical protein